MLPRERSPYSTRRPSCAYPRLIALAAHTTTANNTSLFGIDIQIPYGNIPLNAAHTSLHPAPADRSLTIEVRRASLWTRPTGPIRPLRRTREPRQAEVWLLEFVARKPAMYASCPEPVRRGVAGAMRVNDRCVFDESVSVIRNYFL